MTSIEYLWYTFCHPAPLHSARCTFRMDDHSNTTYNHFFSFVNCSTATYQKNFIHYGKRLSSRKYSQAASPIYFCSYPTSNQVVQEDDTFFLQKQSIFKYPFSMRLFFPIMTNSIRSLTRAIVSLKMLVLFQITYFRNSCTSLSLWIFEI